MKIELSKTDIENAVKAFVMVWFPELEPKGIEFKRTKKVNDITVIIETKIKEEK